MKNKLWVILCVFILLQGCGGGGTKKGDSLDTIKKKVDEESKVVVKSCKPLTKTGQTISHRDNDDGDYQKGVDRSYTRDDVNNIVIDNVSNLMWQDNESITKQWITQISYDLGNYNDTSGDTATTYCENFTLGGFEDWRLPTIEELVYITDKGRADPSIDPIFHNIAPNGYELLNFYWSSTTLAGNTTTLYGTTNNTIPVNSITLARTVYFFTGIGYWFDKRENYYVRCVRG